MAPFRTSRDISFSAAAWAKRIASVAECPQFGRCWG